MELVDIGVNLTHRSFDADLSAVLQRAQEAGVFQMVLTGTSAQDSALALTLAAAHPGRLWCTVGVHPHHASALDTAGVASLRALAQPGESAGPNAAGQAGVQGAVRSVVAIGECGLDYNRDFSPRDAQRSAFVAQLELAIELGLPVFLHERDAHEDFAAILGEHRGALEGAVVHCFTGQGAALDAYLALDCHIGITGWICDERRGQHLRDLVPRIPSERLMLETDAPFLLPRTLPREAWQGRKRSRRNEPAFLPFVLHAVAEARAEDPLALATATAQTARRFFGL